MQGTRLVKNLIDPSAPSNKEFRGIEDLIEKMSCVCYLFFFNYENKYLSFSFFFRKSSQNTYSIKQKSWSTLCSLIRCYRHEDPFLFNKKKFFSFVFCHVVMPEEINEMSDIEFISRLDENKKKTNRKERREENGQTKTDQDDVIGNVHSGC